MNTISEREGAGYRPYVVEAANKESWMQILNPSASHLLKISRLNFKLDLNSRHKYPSDDTKI